MTAILSQHRLLQALYRQPVDRTPVWLMRQAGRYLPEYRALRAKVCGFMKLCCNPELACKVTLQPLQRFKLDAAILFSDILTIADAMGLGLQVTEGIGPWFERPLTNRYDIMKLGVPDPEQDLAYVIKTIRLVKGELKDKLPLIGFAGSPWTLATYMLEGRAHSDFAKIKAMVKEQPALLHQLLTVLTQAVSEYLNAQIAAGVDVVMLFDTWGNVLIPDYYQAFSLAYIEKIITRLQRITANGNQVAVILFVKNIGPCLQAVANSGCDAIALDDSINMGVARRLVGNQVALQGNLSPLLLSQQSPPQIRDEVKKILDDFGNYSGHVFNLGHGIMPNTPLENVQVLIDTVCAHDASLFKHSSLSSRAID